MFYIEPYPVETKISPEMLCHVKALSVLFESATAVTIPIRPTDCGTLRHVIGDMLQPKVLEPVHNILMEPLKVEMGYGNLTLLKAAPISGRHRT